MSNLEPYLVPLKPSQSVVAGKLRLKARGVGEPSDTVLETTVFPRDHFGNVLKRVTRECGAAYFSTVLEPDNPALTAQRFVSTLSDDSFRINAGKYVLQQGWYVAIAIDFRTRIATSHHLKM